MDLGQLLAAMEQKLTVVNEGFAHIKQVLSTTPAAQQLGLTDSAQASAQIKGVTGTKGTRQGSHDEV